MAAVDYTSLTVAQIKEILDNEKIKYPSSGKKSELINILMEAGDGDG